MAVRYSGQRSSGKSGDVGATVGRRIGQLRSARKMSLRGLAEKSGVSSSMICDIENGTKSPTIAVLSAIAESLGLRLSGLVAETHSESRPIAVRRKKGSPKIVDARGIERRQLAPDVAGGTCEIVQLTIPPRKSTGALAPHATGTTEYITLAAGALTVQIGNRNFELKAGDSIGFQADVRHAYSNAGSSRARLYVVIEHAN